MRIGKQTLGTLVNDIHSAFKFQLLQRVENMCQTQGQRNLFRSVTGGGGGAVRCREPPSPVGCGAGAAVPPRHQPQLGRLHGPPAWELGDGLSNWRSKTATMRQAFNSTTDSRMQSQWR